jgi:hypothetical protein
MIATVSIKMVFLTERNCMKKKPERGDWLKPGPQFGPSMWDRAAHEVGLTTQARLRWLVEEFAEYRGSDVPADEMPETVAIQACYFVTQQGAITSTTDPTSHLSVKMFQALAADLRAGINNLLDGKDWNVRVDRRMQRSLSRVSWPRRAPGRKSYERIHEISSRYEIAESRPDAAFATMFQLVAQDLIYTSEPWRLARCALKECQRRFVRHDQRQVYCSNACSQAERTTRYKKRQSIKDSPPD